jgi:hypothetical protein
MYIELLNFTPIRNQTMTSPKFYVEKSPTKKAIAAQIADMVMDPELDDIDDALIKKAGRKALANQYLICVSTDGDEGFYIFGTPAAPYRKNGSISDRTGLLNALLPKDCYEAAEQAFTFNDKKTVAEVATILRDIGFQFDKKFQDEYGDKAFTAEIKKVFSPSIAQFNEQAKKKAPAMRAKKKFPRKGPHTPNI